MTEAGQIQFKDGAVKDISLPLSFKGFGAALDALSKE
jgi:invasion protein IalB